MLKLIQLTNVKVNDNYEGLWRIMILNVKVFSLTFWRISVIKIHACSFLIFSIDDLTNSSHYRAHAYCSIIFVFLVIETHAKILII